MTRSLCVVARRCYNSICSEVKAAWLLTLLLTAKAHFSVRLSKYLYTVSLLPSQVRNPAVYLTSLSFVNVII